ncbi:hypothetical protein ACLB2K_004704 [Fragaria x ananassa]
MRSSPVPQQFFVVGRLLTLKRKIPDPKAVIGTLTSGWDLHNRLQMRAREDCFVLHFTKANDRKNILTGGPWFYGRSLFFLAEYDGLEDVSFVPIVSFPIWVEIKGLLDALMTDEAVEKVGRTLRQVEHVDKMNIRRGTRARVRILQELSSPIKEAFGEMPFEFKSRRFPVKLNVKYDRTVGFCKICFCFGLLDFLVL